MFLPGVGVAIPMAECPIGVVALLESTGVRGTIGVIGVAPGVIPPGVGVIEAPDGVDPTFGVVVGVRLPGVADGVICDGVSSQRDRLLLVDGVGVSWIKSTPPRSVRGVSAQPLL